MKYVPRSTSSHVRRGCLSSFKRRPNASMETPGCMLFTRCGAVPHLSLDILSNMDKLPPIVVMSMSTLSDWSQTVKECKGGLGEFTCMQDYLIFFTSHDVSRELEKFNCSTKKALAVRSRGGNRLYSPQEFVKIQQVFKCDMVQVLGDFECNEAMATGQSRMNKAYQRTTGFLSDVLAISKESAEEMPPLFASLEGGLLKEPRTRCAEESAAHSRISGFILEGFHSYSRQSELFWDEATHMSVLSSTISHLPTDKVRVLFGSVHPLAALKLVKAGIDLFDTSYTYQVTERGGALCFPYDDRQAFPKTDQMFELDLTDSKYAEQFVPIMENCTCRTCTGDPGNPEDPGFTKAYIHHLLNTKEMNASILLSRHNIHHYLSFFEQVRQRLDSDDPTALDHLESLVSDSKGAEIDYTSQPTDESSQPVRTKRKLSP